MSSESHSQSQFGGAFDKGKEFLSHTLGSDSSKQKDEKREEQAKQKSENVEQKATEAKTTAEGTTEQAKGKGESFIGSVFGDRSTQTEGAAKEAKGETQKQD